jgi:hypothetical protein
MKKLNSDYKEPQYDNVIELSEDDEFEIGQGYSDESDRKLICKICGCERWIVGQGDYHTSIKCPNCKYEICIHNG